jgi:hypothetical protein
MFRRHYYNHNGNEWEWNSDSEDKEMVRSDNGDNNWIMTKDGLRRTSDKAEKAE